MDVLQKKTKWTALPANGDSQNRESEATLGDLFTIKRGLATGDNSFFILPLDKAERIGIPMEVLRPILPSPRYLKVNVVEARPDGYPSLEKLLGLIDCKFSEDEIHRRFPAFWEYLTKGKPDSVHTGYLASRNKGVLVKILGE